MWFWQLVCAVQHRFNSTYTALMKNVLMSLHRTQHHAQGQKSTVNIIPEEQLKLLHVKLFQTGFWCLCFLKLERSNLAGGDTCAWKRLGIER